LAGTFFVFLLGFGIGTTRIVATPALPVMLGAALALKLLPNESLSRDSQGQHSDVNAFSRLTRTGCGRLHRSRLFGIETLKLWVTVKNGEIRVAASPNRIPESRLPRLL